MQHKGHYQRGSKGRSKRSFKSHYYAKKSQSYNGNIKTVLGDDLTMEILRQYIIQSKKAITDICLEGLSEYVQNFKFNKFDIEVIREECKRNSLEDVLYVRVLRLHKNIREDLRLSQFAHVEKYNSGIFPFIEDYLIKEYAIQCENGTRALREMIEHAISVISRDIALEEKRVFIKNLEYNNHYREIDKKLFSNERRLKSMILDRIPDFMPDVYPLARKMDRHFIFHIGPTNSGKTYDAIEALKKAERGIYLAPLRLLAYEIFDRLNESGVICDMITGEEEMFLPGATHISSTIETLSIFEEYDVAVIDEGQMIGDRSRGGAWTRAILGVCAKEIHICSDASCLDLIIRIIEECGDTYSVNYNERAVPLVCDEESDFIFPESVKDGDALIVFSKRDCIAVTAKLQTYDIKASMIYGMLPYDVRMNEVRRFVEGDTRVVVATDAIGMGLNLPIKRIVFLETTKFDGETVRPLVTTEIKQIAGRAGRRGMFDVGYYTSQYFRDEIKSAVEGQLPTIKRAKLSIPESIIYLDYPLSEILSKWVETANESIYEKEDLTEQLELCKKLETLVDEKRILYDFLNIGFKSNKPFLLDIIMECARMEQYSKENLEDDIMDLIDYTAVMSDRELDRMDLERLEDLYLKYDLIYAYLRKFNHREHLSEIMNLKRDCSAKIIDRLQNEALDVRRCPCCDREIPWNFPFKICEKCHKEGRSVRRRRRR